MTKNKLTKRIGYAFPSSTLSENLGCGVEFKETGCYFIEYTRNAVEGCDQSYTYADEQVGGFPEIEQDLLDSFEEAEGEPCAYSLKYCSSYYTL